MYHGIRISLRHLKRILSARGCYRRKNHSDVALVVNMIERELQGSGSDVGYRQMHQRLRSKFGLVVSRETVRKTIAVLDPEGVRQRSLKRFRRRTYVARGPNDVWHIDGYDKLKPFGFAIHGAIDGYSRRILWLDVGQSNNDPHVVAQYFLDYVKSIKGTSCRIRGDCGTENCNIARIQRFLRRNDIDYFGKEKSFLYGTSVGNQRIEAWWSFQRRWGVNWWINYFKDLRDRGIFDDSDILQKVCLRFCFMPVLRDELYTIACHWNTHNIRPVNNAESPHGRPDVLYLLPELRGREDYKLTPDDFLLTLEVLEESCCRRESSWGCSPEFQELAGLIMEEEDLVMPRSVVDAEDLYVRLLTSIQLTSG